jgi:hypothetical protein
MAAAREGVVDVSFRDRSRIDDRLIRGANQSADDHL